DFDKIGDSIESSHRSLEQAKNKLSSGRGNLVTSVQKLKKLGANASKSLPAAYLTDSQDDQDETSPDTDTEIDTDQK
nr:DNA recombination protein RmuC [Bacteroidia bacterium]